MHLVYTSLLIQEIQSEQGNSWSSVLGQFFSLMVAFAVILFLFYWVSRIFISMRYKTTRNSNLKIIESVPVGYQSSLQLISVGDKVVLIGVTKDRINFICEVNADSIDSNINNLKLEIPDAFKKHLDNFLKKKGDDIQK